MTVHNYFPHNNENGKSNLTVELFKKTDKKQDTKKNSCAVLNLILVAVPTFVLLFFMVV